MRGNAERNGGRKCRVKLALGMDFLDWLGNNETETDRDDSEKNRGQRELARLRTRANETMEASGVIAERHRAPEM